ncbi:translocation/assembly module TamB domain-containing protein [Agarivorans sp. 1_MG-2023]|uniref:translocation/assembly module TamB domain-containing protein n=1 Tax=Agarivorans sp. 1_MG-2023 TaxID=3062634 RepID=UPI0026E32ECC|nr:translocation/assembly module TamB domain-containing protein [Agarivorans sp. 1_MG-2023]MDO6765876.1 translocation/assembly module TamB domain-containing protein [Agarivorans sp. 1_MG-2023]
MIFKAFKYLLVSISALLFCLILGLSLTPSTQWILGKVSNLVDGLTITQPDGNLYKGISAKQLIWQQAGLRVELADLDLALDWVCMSKTQLCVERLLSTKLLVAVDTAAMAAASNIDDPEPPVESSTGPWTPPFPFVLNRLAVDNAAVTIDDIDISWQRLQVQANWQKSTISVDQLYLDKWKLALLNQDSAAQPSKETSESKPLVPLLIEVPDVTMPYQVMVNDLVLTQGELTLSEPALAFPSLELIGKLDFSYLELEKLNAITPWGELTLKGSQGFQKLYASDLAGRWDMKVDEQHLGVDFQLLGDGKQLDAELSSDGFIASEVGLNIAWQKTNIPFEITTELKQAFSVLPEQLSVNALSLHADGDLSGYQMQLQSDLSGLQDLWLNAQLTGDLSQIEQLAIQGELLKPKTLSDSSQKNGEEKASKANEVEATGLVVEQTVVRDQQAIGGFNISGSAAWQPELNAEVAISLDNLQLSHWADLGEEMALPDLDGDIKAKLVANLWELQQASLSGEWLNLPLNIELVGKGDLDKQAHQAKLNLNLANTQVKADANTNAENVDVTVNIDAKNLAELPWLDSGLLDADISVAGAVDNPVFTWRIAGDELNSQDFTLVKLNTQGNLSLDEAFTGQIDLAIAQLLVAGETIQTADLNYFSKDTKQQLAINVEQAQRSAHVKLAGSGGLESWQGQLAKADLNAELGNWSLSNPVDIDYQQAVATIGTHCWSREQSEFCLLSPFVSDGNSEVDLTIKQFDFAVLNKLIPEDLHLEGQASAEIFAKLNQWTPETARLALKLSPGSLTQDAESGEITLAYESLDLNADIKNEKLHWQALFSSKQLGELLTSGAASIDKEGSIDGELQLNHLTLSPLLPFVNVLDELDGDINGLVKVSGKLKSPVLLGEVKLENGLVSGPDVPLTIEQLHTELSFDNQLARLNGGFNSDGKTAQWTGEFSWPNNQLFGQLDIDASQLPINVDPYASLSVSPDVSIKFADNLIDVSGTIAVEDGAIVVKSLPESAVSESSDAIVIEEQSETVALQKTKIDLNVTLSETITLEALGLNTNLKGHLNLKQQPLEALRANGRIELVDGSFKAYGQNLLIEKGWLMFTGPLEQPYLDFEAVRNPDTISDSVTVGVKVVGLADAPQVTLFSDPSMSQNEMLSYLLRGRALSDSEQDDNALSSMLLSAGIGRAEGLVGNVGSTLGLNDLALSTAGSGSTTQVEVSAYVLPGVQVRYGMGVFDPVNELTVKYEILPKLFIEAFSGLHSALDVYYEFYLD